MVLSWLFVAPVALGSARDLQWYFPLAAEGRCISKLRWMQALLCSLFSAGTAAESVAINRMHIACPTYCTICVQNIAVKLVVAG